MLKQYHAKATFFCIGNNVQKHPELFQAIIEGNHRIGNHTFNHAKGWKTTTDQYLEDVKLAQDTISKQLGNSSNHGNLFRPPFGQIKNSQANALIKLGYKIIMWSVITFDWEQDITKAQCLKNAMSKTNNGDIVVFHDSVKAFKNMRYALPEFLDYFSKKGFRFETIDV
ncbi:polysaccharide deacetylase family protein [Lacinutrix neustonica]|uniref:polysaccharide deacetylase family protein n=1 Tax=Lacinutrix neustonica TaxID=2980107 RepID=UPI0036F1DE4D